jgi:hypothetical protein
MELFHSTTLVVLFVFFAGLFAGLLIGGLCRVAKQTDAEDPFFSPEQPEHQEDATLY